MICSLGQATPDKPKSATGGVNDDPNGIQGLLLETLLEEQQSLRTPVTLFSEVFDLRSPSKRFSHLIPLSKPGQGEQYAFEVNLDSCTGCKACVVACHSLNGLDENEAWRDMGLLVGTRKQPYLQTVTTACHHCLEPACAEGCPVLAYDKDSTTGIVRHLDDQCIGCSYCILKCPYDVPKFNLKKGIVRKCDMCHGRLSEGEAPACVQACPNEAIKIVTVKAAGVPRAGSIITGAFDSSYTGPTTHYQSKRPLPQHARAADAGRLVRDHAHTPLSWMLVMTQMTAGAFIATAAGLWTNRLTTTQAGWISLVTFVLAVIGIHLSVLHLGQPLKAWRAFMGWRKSWLSREILAFGAYAGVGSSIFAAWFFDFPSLLKPTVSVTALVGVFAVFTSVMVYVDTQRPFWSLKLVSTKFFGTMLLLGISLAGTVSSFFNLEIAKICFGTVFALQWIMFLTENKQHEEALGNENSTWHKSARNMAELHSFQLSARRHFFCLSGVILPFLMACGQSHPILFIFWLGSIFISQLIERSYFFTACSGSKMPGN